MSAQNKFNLDFDALLAQEEISEVRHEFIGGQLYAMAGATPRHTDIIVNLTTAIHGCLRGKPYRCSNGDQRVRVSEKSINWYYPNFLIKCPPECFHTRDKNSLLNPSAIFEVLSPETERFDRTGKFDEYKLIAELSDYILVDTETARVEHFTRLESGRWAQSVYTRLDQELELENFGINVPMSEIYEDVGVSEQGVLPIEAPEIE